MALLLLYAEVTDQLAKPGNGGALLVAVFVASINGKPVSGLTEQNVSVHTVYKSNKPGEPEPAFFPAFGDKPGEYEMSIFPKNGKPEDRWDRAEYLFRISVRRGKDSGRTLLSVNIGSKVSPSRFGATSAIQRQ